MPVRSRRSLTLRRGALRARGGAQATLSKNATDSRRFVIDMSALTSVSRAPRTRSCMHSHTCSRTCTAPATLFSESCEPTGHPAHSPRSSVAGPSVSRALPPRVLVVKTRTAGRRRCVMAVACAGCGGGGGREHRPRVVEGHGLRPAPRGPPPGPRRQVDPQHPRPPARPSLVWTATSSYNST
jgi:hypothetical protein